MKTSSRHLLVEYRECNRTILNNPDNLKKLMRKAAEAAEATVVGEVFHSFSPQGVSGVVVIEESHLSIHTWPEFGYAAVDFYTCGDCLPDRAHEVLKTGLDASSAEVMVLNRGMEVPGSSIRLSEHYSESESEKTINYNRMSVDMRSSAQSRREHGPVCCTVGQK